MDWLWQGELVSVTVRGLREGRPCQLSSGRRPLVPCCSFSVPQPNQQTQANHCHRQLRTPPLIFTARCTVVQNAVLRLHVVRPSVCPSVYPSVYDVGGS